MGALRDASIALLFCAGTACSLLLTTAEDQCKDDGDCARRGFASARCAGSVCVPADVEGGANDAGVGEDVVQAPADAGQDVDPGLACLGQHPVPTPRTATVTLTEYFHDFIIDK